MKNYLKDILVISFNYPSGHVILLIYENLSLHQFKKNRISIV